MSDYGNTPPPPPPPDPYGQGMPGLPEPSGARVPVAKPSSISQAVNLMRAGALLSLINALFTLTQKDAIREAVEKSSAKQKTPMTPDQIDTAVAIGTVGALIVGLIAVALWLWMAAANGRGRSWARIVATVLFALGVLSFLGSLTQPSTALPRILGLLSVLLGAYVIYLLYRKESTAYYQASSAPQF